MLLAAAPFVLAEEARITGAVLCGFAVGWAMLALLSVRFTDQPQTWAAVPAAFIGLGGLLLVVFGSSVEWLNWVWPPALLVFAVWMVVQARRHLRSRRRRWILYPVFVMLALAAVGGGYETVSAATDSPPAMPGQLIDVGGHRCTCIAPAPGAPPWCCNPGEARCPPTWVDRAGWPPTPECAPTTAPGGVERPPENHRGRHTNSDRPPHPAATREVPGPYVLAGHSFGGLYVLTYAARYPDEVAGMVVIDTTHPEDSPRPAPRDHSYNPLDRVATLMSTTARLGLTRLEASAEVGGLPPQSSDGVRASLTTASHLRSTIDEFGVANSSTTEAAFFQDFGEKPFVVLTAGSEATPT